LRRWGSMIQCGKEGIQSKPVTTKEKKSFVDLMATLEMLRKLGRQNKNVGGVCGGLTVGGWGGWGARMCGTTEDAGTLDVGTRKK